MNEEDARTELAYFEYARPVLSRRERNKRLHSQHHAARGLSLAITDSRIPKARSRSFRTWCSSDDGLLCTSSDLSIIAIRASAIRAGNFVLSSSRIADW